MADPGTQKPELSGPQGLQWKQLEHDIIRMLPPHRPKGKSTPFVPRTFEEWLRHEEMRKRDNMAYLKSKISYKEEQKKLGNPDKKLYPAFGGRVFGSLVYTSNATGAAQTSSNPLNRSAVLAHETIWCGPVIGARDPPPATPWHTQGWWPGDNEMSWEGDQRVATENGRYGRYPGLPRVIPPEWTAWPQGDEKSANPRDGWKHLPLLKPYPFDEVRRVPDMEDIYLPVDEIEDEKVIKQLLNTDLLKAVDAPISTSTCCQAEMQRRKTEGVLGSSSSIPTGPASSIPRRNPAMSFSAAGPCNSTRPFNPPSNSSRPSTAAGPSNTTLPVTSAGPSKSARPFSPGAGPSNYTRLAYYTVASTDVGPSNITRTSSSGAPFNFAPASGIPGPMTFTAAVSSQVPTGSAAPVNTPAASSSQHPSTALDSIGSRRPSDSTRFSTASTASTVVPIDPFKLAGISKF